MGEALSVDVVVASHFFGVATARKAGRRPEWPFVPIIDHGDRTEQIRGRAFSTRAAAVAYSNKVIAARRADLDRKLRDPRYRLLREQYGLSREIEVV